ncbi:MAG: hypothetical protein OXI11_04105 [Gammaproteobacteria bacterium]|nr:hypothetical protein [Gammaproteobacteria bacterium]MXW46460.1 hypothetical protein [Gammaproteobacteria bacterium]MYD02131.1 hypothetical protein [Gammaproteobacteria bacterium]MYI24596.1 hypothetical protein [Gammaproteobacteria bacterium]
MNEPDTGREIDREMAALFSAAETPPESDEQFVAGVMTQIHRRERMRWWVLGSAALMACVFGVPALWELLAAWSGVAPNLLDGLGGRMDQAVTLTGDLVNTAVRSITFLTGAALAVIIFPLLRWLAD